jgi:hypothetical protein
MCSRGCGVDLGIGQHLLGTAKEWMILSKFTCYKCTAETCEAKKCAVEGCDKYPQAGCSGHCCLAHATQEQKNAFYDGRKKKQRSVLLRAAISIHRRVAVDIAWPMRRKSSWTQ